ncbi:hypothetical protein KM043_013590 [Ampulex compressa]|nr:hypothetical protein KM043_013590 [Ampulex compressa]
MPRIMESAATQGNTEFQVWYFRKPDNEEDNTVSGSRWDSPFDGRSRVEEVEQRSRFFTRLPHPEFEPAATTATPDYTPDIYSYVNEFGYSDR